MNEKYAKIAEQQKPGESIVDLCGRFGVKPTSFYSWRTAQKKKTGGKKRAYRKNKPIVTRIEAMSTPSRILAFYGMPQEIMAAVSVLQ